MDRLTFPGRIARLYEPGPAELAAASDLSRDKPRFCVELLLAEIGKRNGNGHKLILDQVRQAIEALGDRLNVPGNLDHMTSACGTSTKIWVDEDGKAYPHLMMEAVYWTREISEAKHSEVIEGYNKGTLGASWEIDSPYRLEADPEEADTQCIYDHGISGFCLTVGKEPADKATKGRVAITATEDEEESVDAATEADKKAQKARAKKYGIGIKEGGHVTKPSKYANVPDTQFADPVNYKYPIDTKHIGPAVKYFNHSGQRTAGGYSTAEWAKIGRRIAKAAGKGYSYKGGNIVTPSSKKADVDATDNMLRFSPWEIRLDFLSDLACPVCESRHGTMKQVDFENGKFLMECGNDDDDEKHRFTVAIQVQAAGQEAAYALVATEEWIEANELDYEVPVEVTLTPIILTEEVNDMDNPLTEEQIQERIDKAVADALAKQKAAEDALAKEKEEREQAVKAGIDKGLEKAKTDAVDEYKERQKVAAQRADVINEIVPYESEEAKLAAMESLAEMTVEEFEKHKGDKEKDKRIAELEAQVAGENPDEKPDEEPGKEGKISASLPAGDATLTDGSADELLDPRLLLRW